MVDFSVFAPQRYFLATLTANKASLKKPMTRLERLRLFLRWALFGYFFYCAKPTLGVH